MPPRLDVYNSNDLTGEPVGAVYVDNTADLMAVKVDTSSLPTVISTGDTVIIDKAGKLKSSAIVFIELDNKTDFRRVLVSDDVTLLVTDDPAVAPIPLTAKVRLIGTAVEIRKAVG